jgi:acyl-CoA thioesterase-2
MTTASIVPPPAPQYLSEVLELEQLDTNLFRSKVNQVNNNRSLFGGQILGQGLKAAALTVEPGRRPHSLHGYFLLAGMSDINVIYDVELTRDGGSFSTRRVVARQRAKPIFHMELSFHREEQGFEHQVPLDIDVPEPEELMSTRELATKFADRLPKSAQAIATQQAIVELKPVSPEDYFLRKAEKPRGLYWIKSTAPLPADVDRRAHAHGVDDVRPGDDGEPRPRDVVPPAVPRGRLGVDRRDQPVRRRSPRPDACADLRSPATVGRLGRPGRFGPALGKESG